MFLRLRPDQSDPGRIWHPPISLGKHHDYVSSGMLMLHKQDPEVNCDIYDNMNSIVTYIHMSLSVSLT